MHEDRTADPARLAGTVRGLGVCDVLRVELSPRQHPALEAEIARRATALQRGIDSAQAKERRGPAPPRRGGASSAEDRELQHLRVQARVLARVRDALPSHPDATFVLTGPAGLVLALVAGCLRCTVAELDAGLGEGTAHPAAGAAQLEAVAAWIATALDCRAVETFCFEPGVDPVRAA